jgi:hypothetical protein
MHVVKYWNTSATSPGKDFARTLMSINFQSKSSMVSKGRVYHIPHPTHPSFSYVRIITSGGREIWLLTPQMRKKSGMQSWPSRWNPVIENAWRACLHLHTKGRNSSIATISLISLDALTCLLQAAPNCLYVLRLFRYTCSLYIYNIFISF